MGFHLVYTPYKSDIYDCYVLFMKPFAATLSGVAVDQEPGCRKDDFP